MSVKVLHITAGSLKAGAAKGAYWLHLELLKQGIDSRMLLQVGVENQEENVHVIANSRIGRLKRFVYTHLDALPTRLYRNRERHIFSPGVMGFDIVKTHHYKWADLIHFHWINQGLVGFQDIRKIKKPVIWTMRDMWPLTGGCHHSFACEKYRFGCGNCPHLHSTTRNDLSSWVIKQKIKTYGSNIFGVAISSWLKDCAETSLAMKDIPVTVIHNGIDTKMFAPLDKELAREKLGLPPDGKIVLVGASNPKEVYKGFDKFVASLRYHKPGYLYVFFGALTNAELQQLGVPYVNFGRVDSISELATIYSAADVFVAPSIAEAFGKTLVEALACGTPIVAFNATGPKDIVNHKLNGYSSTPFEPSDLGQGVNWVLEDDERLKSLCLNARMTAEQNFNISLIASQYSKLYTSILIND